MKKLIAMAVILASMTACKEKTETNKPVQKAVQKVAQPTADGKYLAGDGPYKGVALDSPKDFYCGMDITKYGPSDTLHYHGKVYGFCATVCKDEFKKEPEKYLAKK